MKSIKIVGVVCLVAVSVLSAVFYLKLYILTPKTAEVATIAESSLPTPQEPAPVIEYSVFPRAPKTVAGGVANHTGGAGEEKLLSSYRLGGCVYALLSTTSNGLDYRALAPSLAVAKFDGGMALLATVTLPVQGNLLAVTPYDYGLLLVVSHEDGLTLVGVDPSLQVATKSLPYHVTSACATYGADGVVVAGAGERLYFFGVDASLSVTFSHSIQGEGYLVSYMYAYAGHYIVFGRGVSDGVAYALSPSGVLGRYAVARPDAITPYPEGYAVVTLGDKATVYRYDYALSYLGATTLETASSCAVGSYEQGLWVVLGKTSGTVGYTLCRHGDVQCKIDLPDGTPTTPMWSGDAFLYWAEGEEGRLVAYTPLTNTCQTLATVVGARGVEWWRQGSTLYLMCDSDFTYGYFEGGFGGRDVYMLKIGL